MSIGCNRSFRDYGSLSRHASSCLDSCKKASTTGFVCETCGRELATKQSLKEHSFIHREKKFFRCSEIRCGKMFRQNSQLCNHRKIHKEAKRLMKHKSKEPETIEIIEKVKNVYQNEDIPEFCFPRENNYFILPAIDGVSLEFGLPP